MSSFIENLVYRHTQLDENIKPLLRAPFEPGVISPEILSEYEGSELRFDKDKGSQSTFGLKPGRHQTNFNQEKQNTKDAPDEPGYEKNEKQKASSSFNPRPGEINNLKEEDHPSFDPSIGRERNLPTADHQIKNIDFNSREQANRIIPKAVTENEFNKKNQVGKTDHLPENGKVSFLNTNTYLSENVRPAIKESILNTDASGPAQNKSREYQSDFSGLGELKKAYQDLQNKMLKAEASQVIKVTIGRIDIRAVSRQAPPALQTKVAPPAPKMSLDEYLKKRNNSD